MIEQPLVLCLIHLEPPRALGEGWVGAEVMGEKVETQQSTRPNGRCDSS